MFGANPFGSGFFADGYAAPSGGVAVTSSDSGIGADSGVAATAFASSDTAVGADIVATVAVYGSLPGGRGGGGFGCNPFGWGYDGVGYLGALVAPPLSGPTVDGGTFVETAVVTVKVAPLPPGPPLPVETDAWYARLAFTDAQAALAVGYSTEIGGAQRALLGWHGQRQDVEIGSFVIVNQDGPLSDLVGKRVLITLRDVPVRRQVVAFCHTSAVLLDDLSVTRRLFFALGNLAATNLPVTVQVLTTT